MLGLICPSTFAFLASAAALVLFVALPASVQPRFEIGSHCPVRRAAQISATPPAQPFIF